MWEVTRVEATRVEQRHVWRRHVWRRHVWRLSGPVGRAEARLLKGEVGVEARGDGTARLVPAGEAAELAHEHQVVLVALDAEVVVVELRVRALERVGRQRRRHATTHALRALPDANENRVFP